MFKSLKLKKLILANDGHVLVRQQSGNGWYFGDGTIYVSENHRNEILDCVKSKNKYEIFNFVHASNYEIRLKFKKSTDLSKDEYLAYLKGCIQSATLKKKLDVSVDLLNFTKEEVSQMVKDHPYQCDVDDTGLHIDWGIMKLRDREDLEVNILEMLGSTKFQLDERTKSIILHNPVNGYEEALASFKHSDLEDDVADFLNFDFLSFKVHPVPGTKMVVVTFQY